MASDAHACLDEAAKASLAGRLFVVDHATLVDDLDSVLDAMSGRVIQPPFEVTPIFMPGFEEALAHYSSSSATQEASSTC